MIMRYVEAPDIYVPRADEISLYLAGGITGSPNWQQQIVSLLSGTDLALLNPRRSNFPIGDAHAARSQIRWEYKHMRITNEILFWFPWETLCPIALYELGAWSMTDKPIYLGVHTDYRRRLDLEIQTQLVRPDVKIAATLEELAEQVAQPR
jgi:hypothetical protein